MAEDTPKNLAEGLEGVERLEIEIGGPVNEILPALRRIRGASRVTHRSLPQKELYTVHVESGKDIRDEISRAVISSGWSLLSMQTVGMSLEEIFLKLTTHEGL